MGAAGPCGRGYINVSSHSGESGSVSAGELQGPGCRPPSITQASELPRRPAFITRVRVSSTVPSVDCWGRGVALRGGEGRLRLSALDREEPTPCQPPRGTRLVAPQEHDLRCMWSVLSGLLGSGTGVHRGRPPRASGLTPTLEPPLQQSPAAALGVTCAENQADGKRSEKISVTPCSPHLLLQKDPPSVLRSAGNCTHL